MRNPNTATAVLSVLLLTAAPSLGALLPIAPALSYRATNSTGCSLNQNQPPGNLTLCGNTTLFDIWRPKARIIAPEGWMNDPMGMFQRRDGSIHAGYQCHPQHVNWGNISQCSAFSKDFVYWTDAGSWKDPKTIWPSAVYDIRGVFDGTIIPYGWKGLPTIIYTSVFTKPIGQAVIPAEEEGSETQSLAYTEDGGSKWIKLNFGSGANPVIYEWPMKNLTGFRDPYVFESPHFAKLLANSSAPSGKSAPSGNLFLTISGGIRKDADANGGPRLMLYRQTRPSVFTSWTYLGVLTGYAAQYSYSDWSGNVGTNFETAGVTRLDENGFTEDAGTDSGALDIILYGTEQGRVSHENHWPLYEASKLTASNGSISAQVQFAGVLDWGRAYAFTVFNSTTKGKKRAVLIGWTYEDDESLALGKQRSYQGAFTLFRDLFVYVIRNVDPASPGLNDTASWTTRREKDGSTSVVTLGQKVVPEIFTEYRSKSTVSLPKTNNLTVGYRPFAKQPKGRYYAINGQFRLEGGRSAPRVGFRVLASSTEYTDIYYDPANETVVVNREQSSLIKTYGNDTEYAKLRLFTIKPKTGASYVQPLNLTVFVDNSVVEVYANNQAVITTRVYPWLSSSKGAGFLMRPSTAANGTAPASASVASVELWDGLINAWPSRPADTRKGLLYDGPLPGNQWGGQWLGW